ncbi:S-layer homology domain-containing protein [Solibacillus sp. FSL K6-1523]|uniref:S-layer homology domain-containing protein n=1 Tax=Solibacillus sp. FSL K6-1523 TaxID=2921471 RepID=UPI0030F79026
MTKLNKSRKFIATSATAALVASAIVPVASAAQINDFNSVAPFAQEAVQDLNDRGVIKGDQKGNFNPKNNVTRAEAATILTNALGLEGSGSTSFADVKTNAWYYDAVDAAVSNGIFQGQGAGKFNPSGNLTRSEAAIILVDAFGLEGSADLSEFKDSASVKSWAQEALEIAVANEVMKGDAGNLKPNASISRQEFAVMYHRTEALEVAEEVAGSVKAINATTVEVTFEETVTDLNALNFAIEGLTISNKAIKQTDSKTVVLTTSAQTADVDYTVTVNGESVGSFKGVSAVIPTAIKTVVGSHQGVFGKDVTLSAEVTVANGQSKAGIPVTFNITDSKTNDKNDKIEVVAYTDDKGVASYSYTRYYKGTDEVVAYASDKATVKASAKVYWASELQLTVKADEKDLKLNDGDSISYSIQGEDNGVVFVAFKENQGVKSDEIVDVKIKDTDDDTEIAIYDKGEDAEVTNEKNFYPYYTDSKDYRIAAILLDKDGEGSFTLTGEDASVTPIVYTFGDEVKKKADFDVTDYDDADYSRTALQAVGETVTFGDTNTLAISIKAEGNQNAAAYDKAIWGSVLKDGHELGKDFEDLFNLGGRSYVATIKDKDNDLVGKGFEVSVIIDEDKTDEDEKVFLIDANGKVHDTSDEKVIILEANKDGEVEYTLVGESTGYATATLFIDKDEDKKLDKGEKQADAERVYFKSPSIKAAGLKTYNTDKNEISSVSAGESVVFAYMSVDQNGKPYHEDSKDKFVTTFSVTAKTTDVIVEGKTVKAGSTDTFKVTSDNGVAVLAVTGKTKGNVTVKASSTGPKLTTVSKTVKFVGEDDVAHGYIGLVEAINTTEKTIRFVGKTPVDYATSDKFYDLDEKSMKRAAFIDDVQAALKDGKDVKVKYEEDKDNNSWTIISIGAVGSSTDYESARIAINKALSVNDVLVALEKLEGFPTLIKADKDAIATTFFNNVKAGTTFNSAAALNVAYETATTNPLKTAKAVTDLTTAIKAAQAKHDAATEGTGLGQYEAGAKAALKTAIDTATTARNTIVNGTVTTTGTNHEAILNGATTALTTAVTAFDNKKVTDARQELGKSITAAEDLLKAATEGSNPGQYAVGSVATLTTAIKAAKVHFEATHTANATLVFEKDNLDRAIATFKGNEVKVVTVTTSADSANIELTFSPALAAAISTVTEDGAATAVAVAPNATVSNVKITVTGTPVNNDTITVEAQVENVLKADATQATIKFVLKYVDTKWVLVEDTNFKIAK